MGRARQKMEYIEKKKSRIQTFKKRKEGLMKKLHELTTLCDVGACMIIYDPTQHQSSIWPEQNPGEVRRLIDACRDSGTIKTYGVSDFLEERRRKVEEETIKLRRQNLESKYPSSDHDCLVLMDESQLRELGAALRCKAQIVRSRIQFLKQREIETINNYNMMLQLDSDLSQFHNLDQEIMDNLCQIYNLDQEIMKPATDMDMIGFGSHNYYTPPMPMAIPPPEPCVVYSSMVQNLEWADDGDDITHFLMQ